MESLSGLLNKLRPNSEDFKQRFLDISAVYNCKFDSDNVLSYLKEDTLFHDDNKTDWQVLIPEIQYNVTKKVYLIPETVKLKVPDSRDDRDTFIDIPFPETIEEFRAMAKTYGITVKLNTHTANMIYGF